MQELLIDLPMSFIVFTHKINHSDPTIGGLDYNRVTFILDILLRHAENLGVVIEQIDYHGLIVELSDIIPSILEYDTIPSIANHLTIPNDLQTMPLHGILDRMLYDIFIMLVDNGLLGSSVVVTQVLGKKVILTIS